MIFTHHAVERYRQFHMIDRPGATWHEARSALESAAAGAVKGGTTHRGDDMWMLPSLGIEVVAKHEDGVDVVVTVLPPAQYRNGPGGQRGLTPLQVEALADAEKRAAIAAKEAKTQLAVVPTPPAKPSADADKRREEHQAATLRKEMRQRVVIAETERELFAQVLKHARRQQHEAAAESRRASERKALEIACRYIRGRARTDLDAGVALAAIESLLQGGE